MIIRLRFTNTKKKVSKMKTTELQKTELNPDRSVVCSSSSFRLVCLFDYSQRIISTHTTIVGCDGGTFCTWLQKGLTNRVVVHITNPSFLSLSLSELWNMDPPLLLALNNLNSIGLQFFFYSKLGGAFSVMAHIYKQFVAFRFRMCYY